jgi:hypothetical protein
MPISFRVASLESAQMSNSQSPQINPPHKIQTLADPLFNGLLAILVAVADFSVMRFTESLPSWFAIVSFCLSGVGIWVIWSRKELSAFRRGMPTLLLIVLAAIYVVTYSYAIYERSAQTGPAPTAKNPTISMTDNIEKAHTPEPAPKVLKNPIDDDAIKWKLAKNLHSTTTNPNTPLYQNARGRRCEVVVVRYLSSTYSEEYFSSIKEIFDTIDWAYHEEFAKSTIPRGLSLRWMAPGNETNLGEMCGSAFKSRLNNDIPGFNASQSYIYGKENDDQYVKTCPGQCFEIDIGNEPNR